MDSGRPNGHGRRGRQGWLAATLAALVLVTAAIAPHLREAPAPVVGRQPEPPPLLAVTVAPVEVLAMSRTIVGHGSVVAWQELVIGAEVAGLRVTAIAVDEGDRVQRGQVMLRFDPAVLTAQLSQADAVLAEGEAALQIARADYSRGTELLRGGSIATQTVEQRQSAARQAEARVLAARAHRDEAAARLAQAQLLAPADGVVVRRSVQLGAVSAEGQELFRLVRDGRLELDARVPELDLPAVHAGQAVRVVHGDWQGEAVVRAVAPTVATETRQGLVHVALADGGPLRPGMFARAEIRLDAVRTRVLPEAAIVYRDDRPAVFVKEPNDRVSLRRVTAGAHRGGLVQILDGLREGELAVTSGAGFLSDGDRVRVVAALALSAP